MMKKIFILFMLFKLVACESDIAPLDREITSLSKVFVATFEPKDIRPESAVLYGSVLYKGSYEWSSQGFVWGNNYSPRRTDNVIDVRYDQDSIVFARKIDGLNPGTKYYYRVFAKNPKGIVYGDEKSFTTDDYSVPVVTTADVGDIGFIKAKCGGIVTNDGYRSVRSCGVVWGVESNPTVFTNLGIIKNEKKTGWFSSELTGLINNTTYYVRAYATNSEGTGYGGSKTFKTKAYTLPSLNTTDVTKIGITTVICGGDIIKDGSQDITERGVVWSRYHNPTISDNLGITTDGNDIGSFVSELTNLVSRTRYYVRAYATNSQGTAYGGEKSFYTKDIKPEMVLVVGGSFQMGSNYGDSDEKPVHSVTLSNFEIAKFEVTQDLWKGVMGEFSTDWDGYLYPMVNVSWNDIQLFITKINEKTGKFYRLPTEAEWEFAAKGGGAASSTTYSGSNTIGDVAWYSSNSGSNAHEVGGKQANELGIYDMSGNVWEWCRDWYDSDFYNNSTNNNPQGPTSGYKKVMRGGSWYRNSSFHKCTFRKMNYPNNSYNDVGFRLVRHLN